MGDQITEQLIEDEEDRKLLMGMNELQREQELLHRLELKEALTSRFHFTLLFRLHLASRATYMQNSYLYCILGFNVHSLIHNPFDFHTLEYIFFKQ